MAGVDVFLSHRGSDTKNTLVDALHEELKRHLLRSFLDVEQLEQAQDYPQGLMNALETAQIYVVVLSPGFADSSWCLKEVEFAVKAVKSNPRKHLFPVFYKVTPRDVRYPLKGCYKKAFAKWSNTKYNFPNDQVEHWSQAVSFLADIKGYEFNETERTSKASKAITDTILKILGRSLNVDTGRMEVIQKQTENVYSLLELGNGDNVVSLGITGQGGIGKTTLARQVYKDIFQNFEASSYLEVGRVKDVRDLQLQMLADIFKVDQHIKPHAAWSFIVERVKGTSLLLLLDGVEDVEQLDNLMPKRLGPGSRVIVTSRDTSVLKELTSIYEVKEMESEDAEQLFELQFGGWKPGPELMSSLVLDTVQACKGIPLALKLIGRSLRGERNPDVWRSTIAKITSNRKLTDTLRLSYDRLCATEKTVFLDTACFLSGMRKEVAIWIWESMEPRGNVTTAYSDIKVLLDHHLLTVDSSGRLHMHDMVRDMGREVVQSQQELYWFRTHIWESEVVLSLLHGTNKTPHTRSIVLSDGPGTEAVHFRDLTGLRLLDLGGSHVAGDFSCMPQDLRCLLWEQAPCNTIPKEFDLRKLVTLHMNNSTQLTRLLPPGHQIIYSLKELNLSGCTSLEEITQQDIECLPLLCRVQLDSCAKLRALPGGLGKLKDLVELNVGGCEYLERLPEFAAGSKVQRIFMNRCARLTALPESIGNLQQLRELDASSTCISSLPSSFGGLQALEVLNLSFCEMLKFLDPSFSKLKRLTRLKMSHSGIHRLPDDFGELTSLVSVNLKGCNNLTDLPQTFGRLENLKKLVLKESSNFRNLPKGFGNLCKLVNLDMGNCELSDIPEDVGKLKTLRNMNLAYNKFGVIPVQALYHSSLQELQTHHCYHLIRFTRGLAPQLALSAMIKLDIGDCAMLESLPDLGGLDHLRELVLCNCINLGKVIGLDKMKLLQELNVSGCSKLSELPGLDEAKALKELYLSGSSITFDDFKALPNLERLSVYASLLPRGQKNMLLTSVESEEDAEICCMELTVDASRPVMGLFFQLVSHDQGWSDYEWDHGRYTGSSLFQFCIIRGNQNIFTGTLINNRHADGRNQLHTCFLRKGLHAAVDMLKPGDKVRVLARSYFQAWTITVKQANMKILYDGNTDIWSSSSLHNELKWQRWRSSWNWLPCWLDLRRLAGLDLAHCTVGLTIHENGSPLRIRTDDGRDVAVGLVASASHEQYLSDYTFARRSRLKERSQTNEHNKFTLNWPPTQKISEKTTFLPLLMWQNSCHVTGSFDWEPCGNCRSDQRPFFDMMFCSTIGTFYHKVEAMTSMENRIQVMFKDHDNVPGRSIYVPENNSKAEEEDDIVERNPVTPSHGGEVSTPNCRSRSLLLPTLALSLLGATFFFLWFQKKKPGN